MKTPRWFYLAWAIASLAAYAAIPPEFDVMTQVLTAGLIGFVVALFAAISREKY